MKSRCQLWSTSLLIGLLVSCGTDDSPLVGATSARAPLLEGRRLTLEVPGQSGEFERTVVNVGDASDSNYQVFIDLLTDACTTEIGTRYTSTAEPPPPGAYEPAPTKVDCATTRAQKLANAVCRTHFLMEFASGVAPYDLIDAVDEANNPTGVISVRRRRSGEAADDPTLGIRRMTVPVLVGSDAASAAILASDVAGTAAREGSLALSTDTTTDSCTLGEFYGTVETTGGERTTLGFVIATHTGEALQLTAEAADRASQLIAATADEQLARHPDRAEARIAQWRGLHDSRLEAINLWFGVEQEHFEPEPTSISDGASIGALVANGTSFPVVTHEAMSDAEEAAIEMLRSERVDPRASDAELASGVIEQRLKTAVAADFPSMTEATSGSTEDFLEALGVDAGALRQGARFLTEESRAQGRPIMEDPDDPTRVLGTSEPTDAKSAEAYRAAITFGDTAVDHGDGHAPTDAYAEGSTAGMIDTIQADLGDTYVRDDLSEHARGVIEAARVFAGTVVSRRTQICVGSETMVGAVPYTSSVRVRLYKVGPDITDAASAQARYSLVWGEEGLRCATRSSAHPECELRELSATPSVVEDASVGASGLGERLIRWDITTASLEEIFNGTAGPDGILGNGDDVMGGSGIPTGGRIYLIDKTGPDGPKAILGFGLRAGTGGGTFSRCTFLPAGGLTAERAAQLLAASASEPEAPAESCAGVPLNPRLPLEDELTEAGSNSEVVEQVFLHYLDRAEQAAARAEHIGERLIAEEMEMNVIAENAAARLNAICGTHISGGAIQLSVPATCASSFECPGSMECQSGRCEGGSLVDMLDIEDSERIRLRRCIEEPTETSVVSLGQQALCGWHLNGVDLCARRAGDTYTAPCLTESNDCASLFMGSPVPDPVAYRTFQTTPLGMFSPELESGGLGSSCRSLALLRSDRDLASMGSADREAYLAALDDAWEGIRRQPWLSQAHANQVAQGLQLSRESGGFWRLGRLMSTGTLRSGPLAGAYPCGAAHPDLEPDSSGVCDGPSSALGESLLCGFGSSCSTVSGRMDTAGRMENALAALALLADTPTRTTYLQWATGALQAVPEPRLPSWMRSAHSVDGQIQRFAWPPDEHRPTYQGGCLRLSSGTLGGGWNECLDSEGAYFPLDRSIHPFRVENIDNAGVWASTQTLITRAYATGYTDAVPSFSSGSNWLQEYGFHPGPGVSARVIPDYTAGTDRVLTDGYDVGAFLDALEMICLSTSSGVGGCTPDDAPSPIVSVEDLGRLEANLQCAADGVAQRAALVVLPGVPSPVAEEIAVGRLSGVYPTFGGEYAQATANLARALGGYGRASSRISSALRDIALDIRIAQSEGRSRDLQRDMLYWQRVADVSGQINRCLAAASPTVSSGTNIGVSVNTGAVFVCADAVVQVIAGQHLHDLRQAEVSESERRAAAQMAQTAGMRMDSLAEAGREVAESTAQSQFELARLASLRTEARAQIARMLFLDTDSTGQEFVYGRGYRGRLNRTRIQYAEAQENAIRLTFLARRAIEQRIGFDLSDMSRSLTLVEAPAQWADSLCTMTGVNYYAHWSGFSGEVPAGVETVADYVQRLRLFLDAYLLDYPFANGRDIAVLSLRNDLLGTRRSCQVEGHNLLRSTENLAGAEQWVASSEEGVVPPVLEHVSETPFVEMSLAPDSMGTVTRATRALGGGAAARLVLQCSNSAGNCGGEDGLGGYLSQSLSLGWGTYLVSWYERVWDDGGPMSGTCEQRTPVPSLPRLGVALRASSADSEVTVTVGTPAYEDPLTVADRWLDACEWRRASVEVTISDATEAEPFDVGFSLKDAASTWDGADALAHVLTIGGVQLEQVPDDLSVTAAPYFPTDEHGQAPVGVCEDANGSTLRSLFARRCESYCAIGSGGACAPEASTTRCFYEISFDMSLLEIERGHLIPSGSFAYNNFNYRTDTLALNLVGTGVRDCSQIADPSSCYASGFIPYSLRHDGPYPIRNHDGEDFRVNIMTGQIQFAKSLAAERYLTNPLSSSDRGLLTDYWRTEFRGRPLNGRYTIRIHETPGFRWDRVEDVQVLLNYRYWTRQE